MPSLANHQSNEFTKLLLIGDAKSGKTGSLVSLVEAGYKLRILDMDNLLDILKYMVLEKCPDKVGNVEFRTLRDKRKATQEGSVVDGSPRAFIDAIKMFDKWKYKDAEGNEVDYGVPANWGPECILVVDSLSRLCDAAWDWADPLTPVGKSGLKDVRATYGSAQDAIEQLLATLTSPNFNTNVIVIAHISYMEIGGSEDPETGKIVGGILKGFPQGIGQKLSPKIAQYFPSVVLFNNEGGKRTIQTNSTPLIDLANPKPFAMAKKLPLDTGLATFFETLRGPNKEAPKVVARRA